MNEVDELAGRKQPDEPDKSEAEEAIDTAGIPEAAGEEPEVLTETTEDTGGFEVPDEAEDTEAAEIEEALAALEEPEELEGVDRLTDSSDFDETDFDTTHNNKTVADTVLDGKKNRIEKYEGQARQLFASILWTHKIQENQSAIYQKRYKLIELSRILAIALTTSGVVAAIFTENIALKVITALISAASLFMSLYFRTYDLKVLAQKHKKTAKELFVLREKVLLILTDLHYYEDTGEDLKQKIDALYAAYFSLCTDAEDTYNKAESEAAAVLNDKDASVYTVENADRFLPAFLRKEKT